MKMFLLLCLAGSALLMSEAVPLHDTIKWPVGSTGALENTIGFNRTNNSSMIPASSGLNGTADARWNGTTQAIQNSFGFPMPPVEKQPPKTPPVKDEQKAPKRPLIVWHPFKNTDDVPTDSPPKSTEEKEKSE